MPVVSLLFAAVVQDNFYRYAQWLLIHRVQHLTPLLIIPPLIARAGGFSTISLKILSAI